MKFHNAVTALILGMVMAMAADAEIDVIVNTSYVVGNANYGDIAKVFLAKASALPGGGILVPVDQNDGSPARATFYSKVTGKNASQLNAYWSKLIFTGQGQPPKAVGTDADVAALVAKNPNMIGYVHNASKVSGIKVIAKIAE